MVKLGFAVKLWYFLVGVAITVFVVRFFIKEDVAIIPLWFGIVIIALFIIDVGLFITWFFNLKREMNEAK